jgi:hypothetical protein
VTEVGAIATEILEAEEVTFTVAVADLVESALLTAVIVTRLAGGVAGAVYSPVEEIVPRSELPP